MPQVPLETLAEDLLRLARLLRLQTHPVRRGEITPEQFWLLRQLGRRGPLSLRQLADGLGISPSSATIACKRLERDGLVSRRRQDQDERFVDIALTPTGRAHLDDWRRLRHAQATRLLAPLSQAERDELERLVRRVLDGVPEDLAPATRD